MRVCHCRSCRSPLVAVASSALLAQRGPAPDPLVKENRTVMLAPHLRDSR